MRKKKYGLLLSEQLSYIRRRGDVQEMMENKRTEKYRK
jgi:hypothetical protein